MAYYLHHNIIFNSSITELIRIELYKKDVEPLAVTNLSATSVRKSWVKGEGDKFYTIISSELVIDLFLKRTDDEEFDDFIIAYTDEWKVIL
jgi:hypothetical protein